MPWTLTVAKQVKKYPTFYDIRRFILVFTTAGHLIPIEARWIWFPSLHLTSLDISQNTNSCYEDRYNISQPVLYFSFEQGFELNQKLLSKVHVIYKAILAANVLKWILIVVGVSLGAISLWIVKQRMDMQSLDLPGIPKTVREVTPLDNTERY
jgi:hypothetical protein